MGAAITGAGVSSSSCSTNISLDSSSALGIIANLSSSVRIHLLSWSIGMGSWILGVDDRDCGVAARMGGSSLSAYTSGGRTIDWLLVEEEEFDENDDDEDTGRSSDLLVLGVDEPVPFEREFLRRFSTALRLVHGLDVVVAVSSEDPIVEPVPLEETVFGFEVLFPEAAIELNFAELARTVPGIGVVVLALKLLSIVEDALSGRAIVDELTEVTEVELEEGPRLKIPLEVVRSLMAKGGVMVGEAVLLRRNSRGGGIGILSSCETSSAKPGVSAAIGVVGWEDSLDRGESAAALEAEAEAG